VTKSMHKFGCALWADVVALVVGAVIGWQAGRVWRGDRW
jgi:uncharacterized membrane protein YfcA